METLHISGKRWFQKTYGNTYFSAKAWIDGELVAEIPYAYGYGDHYVQEMLEHLIERGLILANTSTAPGYAQRAFESLGVKFTTDVADVARERDL